jgi:hypothetical protein
VNSSDKHYLNSSGSDVAEVLMKNIEEIRSGHACTARKRKILTNRLKRALRGHSLSSELSGQYFRSYKMPSDFSFEKIILMSWILIVLEVRNRSL